jgi:hypothetical protein
MTTAGLSERKMMSNVMNLLQRINEVRKSIDYVKKDRNVSTGQSGSYKAVSHDMVTAMVRDHMVKHGVVSWPVLVASVANPFEVDANMVRAKQFRYEATYDFHFANADDPKDELVIRIEAHAMDNADKAPGKALSYAKKYAILKLFEIETGEDDESRVPDEFPVDDYIAIINDAKNMDELKKAYGDGFTAAGEVKNKVAQKQIIEAKDKKKAELEKVAA